MQSSHNGLSLTTIALSFSSLPLSLSHSHLDVVVDVLRAFLRYREQSRVRDRKLPARRFKARRLTGVFGNDHRNLSLRASRPCACFEFCRSLGTPKNYVTPAEEPPTTEPARPARNAGFLRSFWRDVFGFVSTSLCFPLLVAVSAGASALDPTVDSALLPTPELTAFYSKLIFRYRAYILIFMLSPIKYFT